MKKYLLISILVFVFGYLWLFVAYLNGDDETWPRAIALGALAAIIALVISHWLKLMGGPKQ